MGELLGSGAYRIRVKYDVTRGRWCAYKTVCASFTLGLAQVFVMPPVGTSSPACPGPAGRVPYSLLASPWWAHLTLLFPIVQALPVTSTRATSPVALLSTRSVWFGGTLGWVPPTAAAPFVLREPPERLRLTLEVCERKVRKDNCVMFVHVGDKWDGGCAPRALPGTRQWSLVYKVDHLVAAETP